jgi:hypothetical protein
MAKEEPIWEVKRLLFDSVKSPSLRHNPRPALLRKLAWEIMKQIDRGNPSGGPHLRQDGTPMRGELTPNHDPALQ